MKKTKAKAITPRDIITGIRHVVSPRGKTILSKKDITYRKRKHKKKDID